MATKPAKTHCYEENVLPVAQKLGHPVWLPPLSLHLTSQHRPIRRGFNPKFRFSFYFVAIQGMTNYDPYS